MARADFYIGMDPEQMEYLGSIRWGGFDVSRGLLTCKDEVLYRNMVKATIKEGNGNTSEDGWPWPWTTSETSDVAYTFVPNREPNSGQVYRCYSVGKWWQKIWYAADRGWPTNDDNEIVIGAEVFPCQFPDMTALQSIATMRRMDGYMRLCRGR